MSIGLFSVQQVEEKLWGILQRLDSNNDNISQICEDWWELSQDSISLHSLCQFFADEKHKEHLNFGAICEFWTISAAYIVSIHSEETPFILFTLLKNIFLCKY